MNGWKNFYITFEYSKGKYQCPGNDDTYFQGFRDCLTLRKSCTNCKFSKLPRQGDFTIGDFLSLARRELNLTDDKGASTVIVNNPKAKSIFDSIKDQFGLIKEVDVEKIKQYLEELEESVFDFDEEKMLTLLDAIKGCGAENAGLVKAVDIARNKVEKADYMSASETMVKWVAQQEKKGGNAS